MCGQPSEVGSDVEVAKDPERNQGSSYYGGGGACRSDRRGRDLPGAEKEDRLRPRFLDRCQVPGAGCQVLRLPEDPISNGKWQSANGKCKTI